jgi:hypothetical protein
VNPVSTGTRLVVIPEIFLTISLVYYKLLKRRLIISFVPTNPHNNFGNKSDVVASGTKLHCILDKTKEDSSEVWLKRSSRPRRRNTHSASRQATQANESLQRDRKRLISLSGSA